MSDKQALIEKRIRIVSSLDDPKFLRKVTIVNLLLNGATASSLIEPCGESSRTLSSWIKQVDEGGFEALRLKKKLRRPHKLNKEQNEEIAEEIKAAIVSDPFMNGYNVWDGHSLSTSFLSNIK